MQYMLPRLRGWGESMSRQAGGRVAGGGGIGTRGPGETKIETDRRRIRSRMGKLRREIGRHGDRAGDPARRSAAATRCPRVAIAGYTNAGKSSLLNRLTGAGVLVEDALFATLDPTVRRAADPGRAGVHAHRHRRLRPAPAAPAGRGVPLHAGGGRRRRPDAARRRRLRPRPGGPDRGGAEVLGEIDAARGARDHRGQQGRRRPRRTCSTLRQALPGAVLVSARTGARHRAAARPRSTRGCRGPTSRSTCWSRTTGVTWSPGCTRTARCCTRTHAADGTLLTARVDGALAAALERFAVA